MLELLGVSKTYDQMVALQPTSLSIPNSTITTLIGPSGCGKSTLIRMMVGLVEPDSGEVLFDGVKLCPENLLSVRQRMGYVIQEGGLFPHLTARSNVTLLARHLRHPEDKIKEKVAELAELTRFPVEGLSRFPAELSGGERQRVSLMRALMLDPEVLLLDEPLGALDPMIRFELQTDLKRIFGELSKTVVLVTHDMTEAAYFADRIVLLRQGNIVQEGTFEDLMERPGDPFVTQFINAQRSPLQNGTQATP